MDIHQSTQYASYMRSLCWKVEKVGIWKAYRKQFPIIGSFIKIQRPGTDLSLKQIQSYVNKHKTYRVIIEPTTPLISPISSTNPYSPTKTIHIDLSSNKKTIFNRFNESTRRAVRRAEKLNVTITESRDISAFANMKSSHMFPMSRFMQKDLEKLWRAFHPNHATILFAQQVNSHSQTTNYQPQATLAGILLLFHKKTAYYWQAYSTDEGKKKRAPTLLVWEALKRSKKRGCTIFDFEGIYDPRFPKAFKKWKGFTRFKKGFGGKEIVYPEPFNL